MKEILNSFTEMTKSRLTNSLYGTFILSWLVFHWNFIFAVIALDDTKIMQFTGLLKNDYLWQKYFNFYDWYFWFSWIMPFVITYLVIWKLPEWILLRAYGKTEEYESKKKMIKLVQERKVAQEEAKLEEQTAKKITAVAKQVEEEQKIKEADPTIEWDKDYKNFENNKYPTNHLNNYVNFLNNLYSGHKYLHQFSPSDVSYFDALGLIEMDSSQINSLTPKGKYFALKARQKSY